VGYRLVADLVVLVHGGFILCVVLGALLVYRWPRLAWIQAPCAIWGAWIEFSGSICPLTPLENHFRRLAGETGYPGGFIDHYIIPLIYPPGLSPPLQIGIGVGVVAINLVAYTLLWRRLRLRRRTT
jgi:hypothetical protein